MKIISIFFIFLFSFMHASAFCFCIPNFTLDHEVDSKSEELLIVTHASTDYDNFSKAKTGINYTINNFKRRNQDIIYLQGENNPSSYYYQNCNPKYYVLSYGGEFFFNFNSTIVTSVGGHWQACQLITIRKIFKVWDNLANKENFILKQKLDAIYTYGKINLRREDIYYHSVINYIKVVGTNKITLKDILDFIDTPIQKIEFLKRIIDFYEIPHNFSVQIQYKNFPKINYKQPLYSNKNVLLYFD